MKPWAILEGRQRWRRLLFLHWPVPPAAVRAAVPARLPLDLRDGTAWVSVVAFDIEAARLDFLETNARTYVRLPGGEPAVWFFSLEASSRLAVAAARLAYGLPYFHARMARERERGAEVYRTARRGPEAPGLEARYKVGAPEGSAAPESLEEFLIERYTLHAIRAGGRIVTVRVRHDPYPLRAVEVASVSEDLLEAAGVARPAGPPLAHYSDGVDVEVLRVLGT